MSLLFGQRRLALPLLTVLALAVCAGCGSASAAPGHANAPTATAGNATVAATNPSGATAHQVEVSDYQFSPSTLTVTVGTTVTWKGVSGAHTVTSDASAPRPFDQAIGEGGSVRVTFTQIGTYDYHCSVHRLMRGKIIVTA